jgi:predicted cupin superfamily sugar epimerase
VSTPSNEADRIIAHLQLAPHPEGGHFRETFRDLETDSAGRSRSTAILFLLKAGEISMWHRVDAVEVWHWYAGAPLRLSRRDHAGLQYDKILGNDVLAGQHPQIVVTANDWQAARSLGAWTLVGCTVAPGFEFSGFELSDDPYE